MKHKDYILTTLLLGSALSLFSGCGVTNDELEYRYSVKLSSLHYIKDANVSIGESANALYRDSGEYDFNVSVSGTRVAIGGVYVTDENNESNTSLQSTLCANYLPSLDTNASTFQFSAPAEHLPYQYMNINPFTTLLVDTNISKEELALLYPIAATIDDSFDFDVTAARKAYVYSTEETNLTKEICDALQELQNR